MFAYVDGVGFVEVAVITVAEVNEPKMSTSEDGSIEVERVADVKSPKSSSKSTDIVGGTGALICACFARASISSRTEARLCFSTPRVVHFRDQSFSSFVSRLSERDVRA